MSEHSPHIAAVLSAYAGNHQTNPAELVKMASDLHDTFNGKTAPAEPVALIPAVPVNKSIQPEYIICLEDGKKFKTMKRHLKTHYNLTPDDYRSKWGLRDDYPMVAPAYAKKRSALAEQMGLGKRDKK